MAIYSCDSCLGKISLDKVNNMDSQECIIINYNDFSNAIVKVHDKEISLHDLVTCYNQIQIMKKEGTYPEDFTYTF